MSYKKKIIKDFDISSFKMSGGMIGGGGSNPPTTTKGDISGFDTTYARIPIGTNDQVLTADSTQALGLKWADSAGGTEFNDLNAAGTYNPTTQTGNMHVVFEKEGIAAGNVKYYIDGVLQDTYDATSTGQYNKVVDPTTSIQFVAAAGIWTDTLYSGLSINPTSGISDHHGFDISPDGTIAVRTGDRSLICQSFTTPYDMTAAPTLGTWFNGLGSRYGYSVKYGNSGNNLFVGINPSNIYKYNLPNPYYWTGSSISGGIQQTYDPTNSGALGNGQVWGIEFNSDGTKMFTNTNSNANNIYEHTLTTGWDLTTASYSGNSYNTTMAAADMRGFTISSDGVWLYTTTGAAGSTLLYRHEMSTPFDITTATIDPTSINISTLVSSGATKLNAQFAISSNSLYIYIAKQGGGADTQYRLDLQTAFNGNFVTAISS